MAGRKETHQRWLFNEEMVESLIMLLKTTKSDMEGKGLDFEGDLVKLYRDLRCMMAEKYDCFGPKELTEPLSSVDKMSKEEFQEYKRQHEQEQKAIKLGYERIKAKVKKIRSNFQKAVSEGTRSGSGRITKDNWDVLIRIWGGASGAEPLEFGKTSMGYQQMERDSDSQVNSAQTNCCVVDDNHDIDTDAYNSEMTNEENINNIRSPDGEKGPLNSKKKKCPTGM